MSKFIKYELLDGEIVFDEKVVEYGNLKKEFEKYNSELAEYVGKSYENNKDKIMDMYLGENKYYDYIYRLAGEILSHIKEYMQQYIKVFVDHGIYDIKVDDFINDQNIGLVRLFQIADKSYELKYILWKQHNDMFDSGLNNAKYDAYSQVHGNEYGIITNSTAAKIMYGIENEYRLKKSTQKADKEYADAITRIGDQAERWFRNKWMNEFVHYLESVMACLTMITDGLFESTLEKYIVCGIISKELSEDINSDKSNTILENLDLATNKLNVLLDALRVDPFNKEVYKKIYLKGFMSEEVIRFACDFGMKDCIIEELYSYSKELVLYRHIEISRFNSNIKFLALLNGSDEKVSKDIFLKDYINVVSEELEKINDGIYDEKIIENFYQYISKKTESIQESVSKYFDRLFIYLGIDDLEKVLTDEEMKAIFENSLRLAGNSKRAKKYLGETYCEKIEIEAEEEYEKKEEFDRLNDRISQIGAEIANRMQIVYENKNKLFGEGARRRKAAQAEIDNLNHERKQIEENLKHRENENKVRKKLEKIPFVDKDMNSNSNEYVSFLLSQLLRKESAGFITKEEATKERNAYFDKTLKEAEDILNQYV